MKGNLAVLSMLGLFLVGAVYISMMAPDIAANPAAQTTSSWVSYDPPPPPWAGLSGDELSKDLAARAEHGKELYAKYCSTCHGDTGKGDGEAAKWLTVQPRNLVKGIYRFRSTAPEINPRDEDLFRTISVGSLGSPMPGFAKTITSEQDRWALVAYLRSLSKRWAGEKAPRGVRVALTKRWHPIENALGPEPENLAQLAAEKGPALYTANCENCHGKLGHGDGANALEQKDESGDEPVEIRPRNFHRPWDFKRGRTVRDMAYSIVTGIAGTGMPAHLILLDGRYANSALPREDTWAVAKYVHDFSNDVPRPAERQWRDPGARLIPARGKADYEILIREVGWYYEYLKKTDKNDEGTWVPLADNPIEVTQRAVVRITFMPTDDGIGHGQGLALSGYERWVNAGNITVDEGPISITFRATRGGTFTFYNPTQSAPGRVLARMTGTLIVKPRSEQ